MPVETYTGSCHCGNVRFEVDLDLAEGGGKCNCSICRKTRSWSASVKPEAFRLHSDPAATTDAPLARSSRRSAVAGPPAAPTAPGPG